jgi:hypothetical protein
MVQRGEVIIAKFTIPLAFDQDMKTARGIKCLE